MTERWIAHLCLLAGLLLLALVWHCEPMLRGTR